MADALCGPANPLQQFKQHSQLDRTLQQDRLTSRYSPAQNFRSAHPNAGLLDPEFEAFQAGLPASDLPVFHHQPPPAIGGPSQAPSWAADFQRMHISAPPPFQPQQQQQHQQQLAPSVQPAASNWAQGFRDHIAQAAPRAQNSSPSPQAFQYMARYGMNSFQDGFQQPSFPPPAVQSKGKEPVVEQFDEAAFERAFDQAREDMMAVEAQGIETEPEQAADEEGTPAGKYEDRVDEARRLAMAAINEQKRRLSQEWEAQHAENMSRPEYLRETLLGESIERLGDSAIDEEDELADTHLRSFEDDLVNLTSETLRADEHTEEQPQQPTDDDDALAATAQELLEKVEHNKTDKFRNSQFLHLMRRLRDREVKVEGDQMVETVRATTLLPLPTSTNSAPDSAYASGGQTPTSTSSSVELRLSPFPRSPPPEFDSHIELGYDDEHAFDHWESPYT